MPNHYCSQCCYWLTHDQKMGSCEAPAPYAIVDESRVRTSYREGLACECFKAIEPKVNTARRQRS